MRELIGLIAIFGALLGIYLIWGSGDRSGLLGVLLLTGAGLFLLYRSLSDFTRKSHQLLSQQISRLEEQLKASQNKPMADQVASADRPRDSRWCALLRFLASEPSTSVTRQQTPRLPTPSSFSLVSVAVPEWRR